MTNNLCDVVSDVNLNIKANSDAMTYSTVIK